uniref:Uncharacterized protein n=1 Tax=Tanacetum cinerariifolium TaxID=118510 RepID=A0A699GM73_TANCI|nr:hypothetical protein [Tanacetum cinerariifolium]
MADLAFAPQHNIVAYLEKTEEGVTVWWAATTASLDAQHDSSNIANTQSKVTLNEPNPQGEGSDGGHGHQETMGGFHPFRADTSRRHSLGRRKVSKQGRKNLKSQQKFQDIDDLVDEEVIVEDKGSGEKGGSIAETTSTARPNISAVRPDISTAEPKTPLITTILFDDEDVTIADTLVKMKSHKAKEKGVAFKDVNDYARPIRSITTLQPLPTIDLKDKKEKSSRFKFKNKLPKKKKVNDKESIDSDKELRKWLKVVPYDDKAINYETLDVKSPIVDCESQVLGTMVTGDVHVYKLNRLDGSYRHFSTFSRMLKVLDRQDVLDLHKIVMERFPANDPEGVHTLILDDSLVFINMFVEKRYQPTKEILEKMLSWRLEAETESTLALDLIKFIKLQIEEK